MAERLALSLSYNVNQANMFQWTGKKKREKRDKIRYSSALTTPCHGGKLKEEVF